MVAQRVFEERHTPFASLDNIDFNFFVRFKKEEKICPVCGKKFIGKTELFDPKPYTGKCCSTQCRLIYKERLTNRNKVSEWEFRKIYDKWIDTIRKIARSTILHFNAGRNSFCFRNFTSEDLEQEALFNLFLVMSRYKKSDKNVDELNNTYMCKIFKSAILSAIFKEHEWAKETETAVWGDMLKDERNADKVGLDSFQEYRTYSSEYTIDLYQIWQEIKELLQKVPTVKMAVEYGFNYANEKAKSGKSTELQKKYKLPVLNHYVTRGAECIYFTNPNVSSYIDKNNLAKHFKFNDENPTLFGVPVKDLSKEEIIRYYRGERKCSVCGKWFKAPKPGNKIVACSKECKRVLRKRVEEKRRKNGKQQACEKRYRDKRKGK